MVRAVEKHRGLVYQFVGDGIMAVFSAPSKQPEHATFALKCADVYRFFSISPPWTILAWLHFYQK